MNTITMHIGDVRDVMRTLDDHIADMLATSPPFLALRSYLPADHPDKHREIGSEPTPAAFLDTLYGLSADWRRLVPEWGSICVELGDTMANNGGPSGDSRGIGLMSGSRDGAMPPTGPTGRHASRGWPETKSMCLIPHLYTIGLAYGHNPLTGTPSPAGRWRVRNVVAWARPNPPVGSLGKRNVEKRTGDQKFRPATSYITIACTGTGRYFDLDAVRTEYMPSTLKQHKNSPDGTINGPGHEHPHGTKFAKAKLTNAGAPPLDWHTDDLDGDWLWKLATAPYSGSHYAVYPLTLPRRLVLAMCPERVCTVCGWPSERIVGKTPQYEAFRAAKSNLNSHTAQITARHLAAKGGVGSLDNADDGGVNGARGQLYETTGWTDCGHDAWRPGRVLDPFGGSGTTAVAAALEGRDAVLIDIDARNIELVHRRLTETVRIVNRVDHPDRVEWTVTPAATSELAAIANGQPSLFDPPKEIA